MKIEIKNHITGEIIASGEYRSVREILARNRSRNFTGALLRGADLYHADLEGMLLAEADLEDADLEGANLRNTKLSRATLTGANMRGAKLIHAELGEGNMRGADLEGANLRGANLYHASLHGANLNYAHLQHTDMMGACLKGASVEYVNYQDTNMYGVTGLSGNIIFISGSIPDAIRINTIGQAYVKIGDIKRTRDEWLATTEHNASRMGISKEWIPRYMEIIRALA